MEPIAKDDFIIGHDDLVLVTGASGFIGSRLVANLQDRGFRNIRCFVRSSCAMFGAGTAGRVEVIKGNLLSRGDCYSATKDVSVIYHLAAGRGERSFPDAFLNSVVITRNLLEASMQHKCLKRFVNVSSFTVYSNTKKRRRGLLDESCPVETSPELRGDAYCFAKVKQEEIVTEYGKKYGIPWVIVRPGHVYGPGNEAITGRVGIGTFGVFLHLGGSNSIPLTFVDNCADAIALVGLQRGTDNEVFNVVDDDLPSSRRFLHLYKKNVRSFRTIYIPHLLSYMLCCMWERYSVWSKGQLPPAFNRRKWYANWKKTNYSNDKLKTRVGWSPKVPTIEGFRRYFESCRDGQTNA